MALALLYLICFILVAFSLPCTTIAQTSGNVSLGSSLTAKNNVNSSFWPSPSGEFAFGFRQIGNDGFLLAIWFNKIPERTIVWSANRDRLVPQGSKVELTSDGQFVLNDARGNQIWSADSFRTGVSHVAMLDTGNFVLANRNSTYLWESFDQPTDTILPTQTLNQNGILFARYTETNYSTGRFMFSLLSDGNLLLSTTTFPQHSRRTKYWSAGNTDIGFQVIFNQSGLIYLTSKNGTILDTISRNSDVSNEDFYQRATLDYDGVLRHYVYPKSSGSRGRWSNAWSTSSFIPSNICTALMEFNGVGACGFNSICRLDDLGPSCQCPNGYTFIDPNDVLKGCKQNFFPQSCGARSSPETDAFAFQELQNTDMPFMDYAGFDGVTEDWCRQSCLEDCFCAVAIFDSKGECGKKGLPFTNGRTDPGVKWTAVVKFRKDNSTLKEGCSKKKDDSTLIIVGSVLLSSFGILNFILPLITYLVVSRIYSRKAEVVQPYQVMPGVNLKYFTYEELKQATNEFKEELGRGASATVFKGFLASDKGKFVAVKSLDAKVRESDLEFNAEVGSIGRTNHKNLVHLLGFCNEGQHRILVYEFMRNGSLASFLFGESRPNWYQRRQIALGTARGLLYLHEECSSQIIHCDIKPQNILLDDSFEAKISDFGLAKILRMDQTRTNTGIRGTKGYVAPEWFKNSPITSKVDVYSFGILLLEIICCRKKFDEEVEDEDQMILADWAYDCYKQKKLHLLFENNDEAMEDIKKMEKYMMIAIWCVQEDPSLRPNMKNTIQMLEGIVEVSIPPNPSSFISSSL